MVVELYRLWLRCAARTVANAVAADEHQLRPRTGRIKPYGVFFGLIRRIPLRTRWRHADVPGAANIGTGASSRTRAGAPAYRWRRLWTIHT